jgi:hypothetical protein
MENSHLFSRGIILFSFLLVSCGTPPLEITEHWDDLEKNLRKGVQLLDRYLAAENPGFMDRVNVFKKDKGDLERDLAKVVEDAVEILDVSELRLQKREINELLEKSRSVRSKVSELRFDQQMASEDKRKDLSGKLSKEEQRLKEIEREIEVRKSKLGSAFREKGIALGQAEIDTLIYSITGDDDIQLFTVYENIRTITEKLRAATVESGESLEISRRYFGMHVLLLRSLQLLQSEYLRRIEEEYMGQLEAIISENRQLIKEADGLIQRTADADREQVEANKRAALLTQETSELYVQYLKSNRDRVQQSLKEVEQKQEVALHTYRTVTAASSLVSLMNESEQFLESLSGLQVPELLVFKNSEVRMKFRELTERMNRK